MLVPKDQKAVVEVKEEECDNRSLPEILQDVHLTNLGMKDRTYSEQVADRVYLQDCIACWDLANANPPIRGKVYKVLMEKYWLIGDMVGFKRKPIREDKEYELLPLKNLPKLK